jgi:GT2 family glycosyltransferase
MANSKITIGTIITCHNRRNKTLKALRCLYNQQGIEDVNLHIYLVDDGSTDGTTRAVKSTFPDTNLILGDGTLFWNGGMRLAFKEAMKNNHDYYFWLNDDTFLYDDALKKMIDHATNIGKTNSKEVIVTGTIIDPVSRQENYGGRKQKDRWHPLIFNLVKKSDVLQKCDTFNGNAVLIPDSVTKSIGNISREFSKQHSGDIDYGLRAKYAGYETWVIPRIIGECSSNTIEGTIFDNTQTLKDRIRQMKTPRGVPPAKEWMIFTRRHGGILWPYFWIRTIIRVIFPFTYLFARRRQN